MIYRIITTAGFQGYLFINSNTFNDYMWAGVFTIISFIVLFTSMIITFNKRDKLKQESIQKSISQFK